MRRYLSVVLVSYISIECILYCAAFRAKLNMFLSRAWCDSRENLLTLSLCSWESRGAVAWLVFCSWMDIFCRENQAEWWYWQIFLLDGCKLPGFRSDRL